MTPVIFRGILQWCCTFILLSCFTSVTLAQTANSVVGDYNYISINNSIRQFTSDNLNITGFSKSNSVEHGTVSLGPVANQNGTLTGLLTGNILSSDDVHIDRECGLNCDTDQGRIQYSNCVQTCQDDVSCLQQCYNKCHPGPSLDPNCTNCAYIVPEQNTTPPSTGTFSGKYQLGPAGQIIISSESNLVGWHDAAGTFVVFAETGEPGERGITILVKQGQLAGDTFALGGLDLVAASPGTNMNNASLHGKYNIVTFDVKTPTPGGGVLQSSNEVQTGTATFDGLGGFAATGSGTATNLTVIPPQFNTIGTFCIKSESNSFDAQNASYNVLSNGNFTANVPSNDGNLTFSGTVSSDGNIFVMHATRDISCGIGCNATVQTRVIGVRVAPTFRVTFRTFIPGNYAPAPAEYQCRTKFPGPKGPPDNLFFAGDTRGFSLDGTWRTQQIVRVNTEGFTDQDVLVAGPLNDTGITRSYAEDALADGVINASDDDGILHDCHLLQDTGKASTSGMHVELTRLGPHTVSVHLFGGAANPLVLLAPEINWDMTVIISSSPNGNVWSLSGQHDNFPAYELYVNDFPIHQDTPGPGPYGIVEIGKGLVTWKHVSSAGQLP